MKYFEENNNTLVAHFEFKNFKQALDFVNRVGEIAENLNHHPNINMYEYKFVQVATTTHDS
jgi:4a-hydroxytetrahydrobiopterin dehydratase